MEKNDSTEEKTMRVNFKQTAKGYWYAEFSAKADTIEEVEAKVKELRALALNQVKDMNILGGQK